MTAGRRRRNAAPACSSGAIRGVTPYAAGHAVRTPTPVLRWGATGPRLGAEMNRRERLFGIAEKLPKAPTGVISRVVKSSRSPARALPIAEASAKAPASAPKVVSQAA